MTSLTSSVCAILSRTKLFGLFLLLTAVCSGVGRAQSSDIPAVAANWEEAGWGGGGYFYCAAYHPAKDGVMYMGGDVNGVYKTEDHGRNWRIINNGIAAYGVFSLAVDRMSPETVYAATEEGLCKSTDGGEHWQTLPQTGRKELRITGEKGKTIRSIAVDPSDSKVVYAASPIGKLYKSPDGGQTWAVSYEKKASETETGVLRAQYGKVNGEFYGGVWLQLAFPADAKAEECIGYGFTLKGDGSTPKDSFMLLKTSTGGTYRSKNLNGLYKDTEWRDIVLKAEDFEIDPDWAKANATAAADLPPKPVWSTLVRMDLACSGPLQTESTVAKFKKFFFAFTPAEGSAEPRLVTVKDFIADKTMQSYGNLQLGEPIGGPFYSVAVSAKNPKWVAVATRDCGLVLSQDAGQTWTELPTPTKASNVYFDPANENVIYGTFYSDGIQKSTDAGKTWTPISSGLPKGTSVYEVVVSPKNSQDVYAIGRIDWSGAFFLSNDGGATWKNSSKIAVDPVANPTLDGVFGGSASLSAPTNIAMNPGNPKEVFLSANWRPCLSTDGGLTWTERDKGADISCVTDIRFLNGKAYATVMDEGTLVSDNNGATWQQLWPLKHIDELSGHNWRIAITGSRGSERIITTVSPWSNHPNCVILSEDGGKTYKVISAGLPDYIIRPNTMWGQGYARALCVDPNDPKTVYLGIDGDPSGDKKGGGIFKSVDGGNTWAQLANQPGSRRMYYGLAVDPTDSKRIFWAGCAKDGGLYRSQDQGATWECVLKNENFLWNIFATADGTIYCSGANLWRSTDHGTTWTQVTQFKKNWAVVGIEVHPRDPKTIWISVTTWDLSSKGGVYKTVDGGTTWTDITGNIPYVKPQVLRFNADTNELWAGYVGMYKLKQ